MARRISNQCDFDNVFIQYIVGQSGGIWILWMDDEWRVNVRAHDHQFILMSVQRKNSPPWMHTTIFRSPHYARCQELWSSLVELASDIHESWAIMEDLNAINVIRNCLMGLAKVLRAFRMLLMLVNWWMQGP